MTTKGDSIPAMFAWPLPYDSASYDLSLYGTRNLRNLGPIREG